MDVAALQNTQIFFSRVVAPQREEILARLVEERQVSSSYTQLYNAADDHFYDPELRATDNTDNETKEKKRGLKKKTNIAVVSILALTLVAVGVVATVKSASNSATAVNNLVPAPRSLKLQSDVKFNVEKPKSTLQPNEHKHQQTSTNKGSNRDVDPGNPLILTPLVDSGDIEKARKASRVHGIFSPEQESYSGFFTVNKKHNSNMFFWFFPSEVDPATAPLLIWIEGGPAQSGLYTLFVQTGPWRVDVNQNIYKRNTSWSGPYNVIYVDQPIGTGYSFADSLDGYAHSRDELTGNMYNFLRQFLTMFPEYKPNDFYLCGVSYGGKVGPEIVDRILLENDKETVNNKINFKGMILASGLTDPKYSSNIGNFYYQTGLVDRNTRNLLNYLNDQLIELFEERNLEEAGKVQAEISKIAGEASGYSSGILTQPDFPDLTGDEDIFFEPYVIRNDVRKSLHVGNLTYHHYRNPNETQIVRDLLGDDLMASAQPQLEDILRRGYRILFFSGQYDLVLLHTVIAEAVDRLEWPGADDYSVAPRKKWYVNGELAGYVKTAGNVTHTLVRDCGHIVIRDKQQWAYDLVTKFIDGKDIVE